LPIKYLAVSIGVDIQLLNEAPPAFAYRALIEGRIIVERKIGMSSIMKIHVAEEMRRLKRIMRNAEKRMGISRGLCGDPFTAP